MISLGTAKAFLIGFFAAFGWHIGKFMTETAIIYWIDKLRPAAKMFSLSF